MDVYFDHLVVKDREQREGFPPDIMAAIFSLSAAHVKRFKFAPFDSYEDRTLRNAIIHADTQ